jgi:RHS repeat-associated protein
MGITGSTTNSYNYTGRETDGLGINYYRARYYNPAIGRFLSEDPLGFAGGGTNLYAYAGNNPISFRDSFGLKPGPPLKCTGHGTGCHASNQLFSPSLLALIIGTEIIGLGPEDPFADAAVAGEIAAAEEAAGAAEAADVGLPTLSNLNSQLAAEEAEGAFTESGELSQEAIDNSQQIIDPADIGNPNVPNGFGKYTTDTYQSPSGPFQVHYYMNPSTGEIFYDLDYKLSFNSPLGPVLQYP